MTPDSFLFFGSKRKIGVARYDQSKRRAHARRLIENLALLTGCDKKKRSLTSKSDRIFREYNPETILNSRIFDANFYIKTYPDIQNDNEFALRHFALHGQFEGRRPSIYFDPDYYRLERANVESALAEGSDLPDFLHYIELGWMEGLDPCAHFSTRWYLQNNPDVKNLKICPLYHFATSGIEEGRAPAEQVDIAWYANQYLPGKSDLRTAYASMVRTYPNRARSSLDYVKRCLPQSTVGKGEIFHIDFNGQAFFSGSHDLPPSVQTVLQGPSFPKIDAGDIMTVDIWDTILRRDCHPDEVKLQTARYLYITEQNRLKPFFRNPLRLLSARLQSEASVATDDDDKEYRLEDVFRHWITLVFSIQPNERECEQIVGNLLAHEFMAERRVTRVDAQIEKFLREHSNPKFFASDFYAGRRFIKDLLEFHGVGHHFIGGYVSCEQLKTKRSGRLFDSMQQDLHSDVNKWVHIGDNKISDFAVPNSRGIKSFLYQNSDEEQKSEWHARAFDDHRRGKIARHDRRILSLIEDCAESHFPGNARDARIKRAGARISIIAVSFVLSVLEDAVANGIKNVYFFTREGIFLKKLAEQLIESDPYNIIYPQLTLLEVSRLSTFAPSLVGADIRSFMRMWRQYSSQSLKEFSLSLGLDSRSVEAIGARHGMDWDKKIVYPWLDDGFQSFIKDRDFLNVFEEKIGEQRSALKSYLRAKEFGSIPSGVEMIVDIGWRGTIQDNLAALTSTSIRGHYLGLMRFLNPQPKNSHKIGFLFNENHEDNRFRSPSEIAPLEMIHNSLGGSVVGYSLVDGRSVPQRSAEAGEDRIISDTILPLQEGMLKAATAISDYVSRHGLTSGDLLNLAQQTTQALCERPPFDIADAFFELHHNESFGAGQVEHIGARLDRLRSFSGESDVSGSEMHRRISDLTSQSRWREGLFFSTKLSNVLDGVADDVRMSLPTELFIARAPHLIKMRGQSVSIYCPSPIAGSGGHRTIFNVSRALAKFGFNLEVFVDGVGDGLDLIEDWLAETPAQIHSQWHAHIKADFALATVARSARYVAELPHARTMGYLVQDLESLFNPVSDGFLVAENSYRYGLRHYTIGNWLCHLIPKEYGAQAVAAGLGVDTNVYGIDPSVRRELAVCCLFQPDKFRRLPQTALDALRIVSDLVPEVKIYLYGSDLLINPDFRVEQLGLIKDLNELNQLYNRCSVGLCLSMSNPSRIPFEMMAAGCIPVDLYRQNNLFDYADGSAVLAYQSAESIADAIVKFLTAGEDEISAMREKARIFASGRSLGWEVDTIANHIVAQMEGRDFVQRYPKPTYTKPAHLAAVDDTDATRWFCSRQSSVAVSEPVSGSTFAIGGKVGDAPMSRSA